MALYAQEVTAVERATLEQIARAKTAPVRLVKRARIVLLSIAGLTVPTIAAQVGVSEKTARQWIKRFTAAGLAGLDDAPRPGRPPTYAEDAQRLVIAKARSLPPKLTDAAMPPTCHWTLDRLTRNSTRTACRSSAVRSGASCVPSTSSGRSPAPGWRATIRRSPKKATVLTVK